MALKASSRVQWFNKENRVTWIFVLSSKSGRHSFERRVSWWRSLIYRSSVLLWHVWPCPFLIRRKFRARSARTCEHSNHEAWLLFNVTNPRLAFDKFKLHFKFAFTCGIGWLLGCSGGRGVREVPCEEKRKWKMENEKWNSSISRCALRESFSLFFFLFFGFVQYLVDVETVPAHKVVGGGQSRKQLVSNHVPPGSIRPHVRPARSWPADSAQNPPNPRENKKKQQQRKRRVSLPVNTLMQLPICNVSTA